MTASVPIIGPLMQVAQQAADLDQSVAFYVDILGGTLLGRFDPPGLALVELGGVRLLLERGASAATLYFRVADIDATDTALRERGLPMEGEPHVIFRDTEGQFGDAGEEEWMTFVRDPNGNLVGFVERRAPRG